MIIDQNKHLTYCTNIHPGESWEEVFESLRTNVPMIKSSVAPGELFGLGLRLSNRASEELLDQGTEDFKKWLMQEGVYVFTVNGFPYGGFHRQVVKDQVHHPDWTTKERLSYTLRLFEILSQIIPGGQAGGISTSPLSYKPWLTPEQRRQVFEKSAANLIEVVKVLHEYSESQGIVMHLDIEPEPDGLIENTRETIDFFENWLVPTGQKVLCASHGVSQEMAKAMVLRHIQICYDVCHFALVYEQPEKVMLKLQQAQIKVGKIQISAALKKEFTPGDDRNLARVAFSMLNEPTYLHQVIARNSGGEIQNYNDLPQALESLGDPGVREWRTHFHVPVFVDTFGELQATQEDIIEVLRLWKEAPMTAHLEVETYTWEVLPPELQLSLTESISRELHWVMDQIKKDHA